MVTAATEVPFLMLPSVPLLMLAEKEDNPQVREFFDLSTGITDTMNLPELAGKCCLGVGYPGWLFTADEQGNMNLFHIFTHTLINLPHMSMLEGFDFEEEPDCTGYVEKAVISADPLSSSTDYVLALIQGSPATFALWRPGDTSFTSLGTTIPDCAYSDITWHDGDFYGPNFMGDIVIFGFQDSARVVRGIPPHLIGSCQLYIVHSRGELLVIHRDGPISDEGQEKDQYGAKTFHVYKINDVNSTSYSYEEIKDLGNRALFVGNSATLAIEDDQASGCKGNHIYFTDDCLDSYFGLEQGGGKDMGVYNLLDGTIVPHYTGQSYHKVTPPLWV